MPLYSFQVPAGFPSPAADRIKKHLSPDELFEIRGPHVHLAKIADDSMECAGIFTGDLVIVDHSRYAEHGDIIIAALSDEPMCKRLYMRDDHMMLQSGNSRYPPRHVMERDELTIWGVVRYSIRDHEKTRACLRADRLQQLLCELRACISSGPGQGPDRRPEQQRSKGCVIARSYDYAE